MTIINSPSKIGGRFMWLSFGWLSLESASFWNTVANWGLLIGLIIGVFSTYVIVVTGNVKEKYFKLEIANSNKQAAEANQKAEEERLARVKIEERLAPRIINRGVFLEALKGKPKAPVEVLYLKDDPECINLSTQLLMLLNEAGWVIIRYEPIPSENPEAEVKFPMPSASSFGGQPAGITIVTKVLPETVGEKPDIPFRALWAAISKSTGRVQGGRDPTLPEDKLRIIVAPKEPWR
jgi:hypothetical protein